MLNSPKMFPVAARLVLVSLGAGSVLVVCGGKTVDESSRCVTFSTSFAEICLCGEDAEGLAGERSASCPALAKGACCDFLDGCSCATAQCRNTRWDGYCVCSTAVIADAEEVPSCQGTTCCLGSTIDGQYLCQCYAEAAECDGTQVQVASCSTETLVCGMGEQGIPVAACPVGG